MNDKKNSVLFPKKLDAPNMNHYSVKKELSIYNFCCLLTGPIMVACQWNTIIAREMEDKVII